MSLGIFTRIHENDYALLAKIAASRDTTVYDLAREIITSWVLAHRASL